MNISCRGESRRQVRPINPLSQQLARDHQSFFFIRKRISILKLTDCILASIIIIILLAKFQITKAIYAETKYEPDHSKPPWLFENINRTIDNLSVDRANGALYVLSGNDILRYNQDLKLDETPLLIRSDSNSSQNKTTSIIFTIINRNGSNLLLSCSTILSSKPNNLTCQIYRVNNPRVKLIGWSYKGENGQDIKLNIQVAPNEQMHILDSGMDNNDMLMAMSRPVLPVSETLNIINNTLNIDTSRGLYMPTLARLNLVSKSLQISSVLPYRSQSDHSDDYIYLFRHGDYTHLVLNNISSSQVSVRLARICSKDTELYSYTEISITCDGRTNIIAKTAYLTDTGSSNRDLYIAFEDHNHPSTSSYICKYSLNLINAKFDFAISQCNQASHMTKSLAKLYPSSTPQDCKLNNLSNDWCLSKINIYIDGTEEFFSVSEEKSVKIKGLSSINFLHVIGEDEKTKEIYFIGTKTGFFTKFNPNRDEILYMIDLFTKKIKYPTQDKRSSNAREFPDSAREAKYSLLSGNVIAITSNQEIHRLPLDSCHFYRTCSKCISVDEPDLCVWCDGMCSRERECRNATQVHRTTCPPQIEWFEPRTGPLSGSTKLSIFGNGFGSKKATLLQVKLDDRDCLVDKQATNDSKIVCNVDPVHEPKNVTLYVTVFDDTGAHDINGTSSLENMPFEYVNVTMYGISPDHGPLSGSDLSVFGNNLDAGSSREILFGDAPCHIIETSNHRILCRVEATQNPSQTITSAPLDPTLRIDGKVQNFTYSPNFHGIDLSRAFLFINDSLVKSELVKQASFDTRPLLIIFIIAFVAFALLFIVFKQDRLPTFKFKLPAAFSSSKPAQGNSRVMFRNPNSHAFNNSRHDERQSESLNGLIKLNGSVTSGDYFSQHEQLEQDRPLMQNFLDDQMLTLLAREKILIDRNRITLGHVLGSGQFGRVYKGFLKVEETGEHAAVAVKTLHSRSHWEDGTDNQAFLEEGLMMKDFNHDNVLALIGVAFESNGLPMVITPFMLYGDLRSYISDEASSPTVKELIEFGTQVAQGMAYLSNQKFVHRDLAARNCMLDENLTVKVADFGLSRDIYERDYYSSDDNTVKLPVKWMAIESLEKRFYTTKSDVWSYGVLLWELMTRGVVPYPDVDNFDLYKYLKGGRRMLRPKYCPVILYNLMLSCWNENPALRPTFDELVVLVSDVITKLKEAKDESGQQKVDKDETYCDAIR